MARFTPIISNQSGFGLSTLFAIVFIMAAGHFVMLRLLENSRVKDIAHDISTTLEATSQALDTASETIDAASDVIEAIPSTEP